MGCRDNGTGVHVAFAEGKRLAELERDRSL